MFGCTRPFDSTHVCVTFGLRRPRNQTRKGRGGRLWLMIGSCKRTCPGELFALGWFLRVSTSMRYLAPSQAVVNGRVTYKLQQLSIPSFSSEADLVTTAAALNTTKLGRVLRYHQADGRPQLTRKTDGSATNYVALITPSSPAGGG